MDHLSLQPGVRGQGSQHLYFVSLVATSFLAEGSVGGALFAADMALRVQDGVAGGWCLPGVDWGLATAIPVNFSPELNLPCLAEIYIGGDPSQARGVPATGVN